MNEGRYSYDDVKLELVGVGARNLLNNAFHVLGGASGKNSRKMRCLGEICCPHIA